MLHNLDIINCLYKSYLFLQTNISYIQQIYYEYKNKILDNKLHFSDEMQKFTFFWQTWGIPMLKRRRLSWDCSIMEVGLYISERDVVNFPHNTFALKRIKSSKYNFFLGWTSISYRPHHTWCAFNFNLSLFTPLSEYLQQIYCYFQTF